jgi:hypothetical protein
MSNGIMPSSEPRYVVQVLPSKESFDMSDVGTPQLQILGLSPQGAWQYYGTLPTSSLPALTYPTIRDNRGVGSYSDYAELTTKDIDGDGLEEFSMRDGTWMGYNKVTGNFVAKTPGTTTLPTPTPSPIISPTPSTATSPTPTTFPSPTVFFTPTASPSPTPIHSVTPSPTSTIFPTPHVTLTPTPTQTVFPTPSISAFPLPTPSRTPVPTPVFLREGDAISATGSSDPDIYIINEHGFKRLFLNPVIFNFYAHIGFSKVKSVSSSVRDSYITSGLFRNCEINDQKVYGLISTGEDTGEIRWISTSGEQAVADDTNFFKKVFCINNNEFDWYTKSAVNFTSVNQVPNYQR